MSENINKQSAPVQNGRMMPNPSQMGNQLDIMEIIHVLLSKILVIILCALVGAGAAGLWTVYGITPLYSTSSMIYLFPKSVSISSTMTLSTEVTKDFNIIASTHEVIEGVISELNLDADYETMSKAITVDNPGSRILRITVINESPQLAADISNYMAETLRQRVADVTDTESPTILEKAVVPTKPSGISLRHWVLRGFLFGGLLAAAIIILLYMMDDMIYNADDVERYLGLNTLAEIPYEELPNESKRK